MRMCQAFADAGHEVVLTGVAASDIDSDPIAYYGLKGGFTVIRYKLNNLLGNPVSQLLQLSGLMLARKARKSLKHFQPDIVYSRLTLTELSLAPRNVPIVYEMHSFGHLRQSFLQRCLFRLLIKRKNFRRIIVTSESLSSMLKKDLPGIEVIVARLSAEPPVSVNSDMMENFRKQQFRGPDFKHHVGYTGYLDNIGLRGTDIICKTAQHMPDTAFHIVGGAPDIVGYWVKYARNFNRHRNIFFYGFRNPSEIPFFLNSFDVALAPLQFRPSYQAPNGRGMSPLKIPQYMGYGKAIVASDIPAHREILRHKQNAWLVTAGDENAWAKGIDFLLSNPAKRDALGKAARAQYESEFTPKKRVKLILDGI